MHFTIEKQHFFEGVQRVQNVVDKKNTIPVLANVLLHAEYDANGVPQLYITATNLELAMRTTVPLVDTTGGDITIPSQKLFEILREMPAGEVSVEVDSKNWATITCDKATFRIAGLPKADFPELALLSESEETRISVPQETLESMLSQTLFAVSHDESRYILTGVLLEFSDTLLTGAAATDGHRLARVCLHEEVLADLQCIVPLKAANEVKKLCQKDDVEIDVEITIQENQVGFDFGGTQLFSQLIEGTFVDYRQVIPESSQYHIEFDRISLQQAIRRVSLLAGDSHLCKFHFESSGVTLSTNDPQLGEASESIACAWDGDILEIGFNAKYMIELLGIIGRDTVILGLNDPLSPGLVTPGNESKSKFIVMPMRL